jgi:DNA-binding HxlR family transcriptional regulator
MRKKRPCELLDVQHLLGNKWTVPLLFEVPEEGISFNELRKRTHQRINPTLLSSTLQRLASHNILEIRDGDKKVYSLSVSGIELVGILGRLRLWGEKQGLSPQKGCAEQSCMECGHFI